MNESDRLPELVKPEGRWSHTFSYYAFETEIDRAEGVYLYDTRGHRYIDASGGPMATGIGHSHPRMLSAIADQMARYAYAHPVLANPKRAELCEAIASVAPGDLNTVHPVSGGSEAVETAIKIAIRYQKAMGRDRKVKVVSLQGSYHGMTLATMAMAGSPLYASEFGSMLVEWPQIAQYSDFLRPASTSREDWGLTSARRLEDAILAAGPDTVAAFIAAPHGCGPEYSVVAPRSYWKEIRRICDDYDVLLIADEIVTGFGRTGTWFGMENFGVQADLMTVAKALASCTIPLGAAVVSDRVNEPFKNGTSFIHGFTYQGHAAACAAGIAAISIYRDEGVIDGVPERGQRMFAWRDRLLAHPSVADVRGWGLFMTVELVSDKSTRAGFAPATGAEQLFLALALRAGIALYAALHAPIDSSVVPARGLLMRLVPPLTITLDQIDDMMQRFELTLTEWEARMGLSSAGGNVAVAAK